MLMKSFNPDPERVEFECADGVVLTGHAWPHAGCSPKNAGRSHHGTVIVNPATGVLAAYYHRYAAFLTTWGFDVLTYDYRGIGLSRPEDLRGCRFRWRDWGEQDFEAVVRWVKARSPDLPLFVVGHSFGGVIPGMAESGCRVDRMLTVGAQFAYWRDYARSRRFRLLFKWHVAMPAMTALYGYFPGKRLNWLEDLPAGVANEWSWQRSRLEAGYPLPQRQEILRRFRNVRAPILAITVSDDDLGTPRAVQRTLAYYRSSATEQVVLSPSDFGEGATGHFGLFHARHASGFWIDTVLWLRDGINPWPQKRVGGATVRSGSPRPNPRLQACKASIKVP